MSGTKSRPDPIDRRPWGELSELVRHDRIKISVAAYAYEFNHSPIMSDEDYDELAKRVHRQIKVATGEGRLDRWFKRHFNPDTGMWIHRHPDLSGIINIHARYYHKPKRRRRKKR